jgi:energy-coupling factor transport system ATP-binding protein
MHKEIAIETKDLAFTYEGKKDRVKVIDGLNLLLYKGETTALVGVNGSGKTTLGKLISGILKPTAGNVFVFGQDTTTIPLSHIGQKIGYSFQNPGQQLFTTTVEEEIAFGLKYRGETKERIGEVTEDLLQLFEIQHLRDSFPLNLSWGEKRRVVLAAVLALEPQYLVLDEPTTGLDHKRIRILNQALQQLDKKGIGMLIISHNESFIEENARRILRMEKGEIIDDLNR